MKNIKLHIVFILIILFIQNANASNKQKLFTKITAISGDTIHRNGAGKRTLFLPKNAKIFTYKDGFKYKNIQILSKGEISSFITKGIKYTAQFTKEGYFYEYVDSVFNPYIFNVKIDDKDFKINSLQTLYGRDDELNYAGAFSGVTKITDSNLNLMLKQFKQVFSQKHNSNNPFWAILLESVYGEYDYKYKIYKLLKIPKQQLLLINDTLYNANEAGNYLWSYCMEYYQSIVPPNLLAEFGTYNGEDEAWEQRAISNGINNISINRLKK